MKYRLQIVAYFLLCWKHDCLSKGILVQPRIIHYDIADNNSLFKDIRRFILRKVPE